MDITERQLRILDLLKEGMTKGVIKSSIGISDTTLDKELAVLKGKFKAINIPNLVYLASENGVI